MWIRGRCWMPVYRRNSNGTFTYIAANERELIIDIGRLLVVVAIRDDDTGMFSVDTATNCVVCAYPGEVELVVPRQ